jgi:hypothetical protein
MGLFDAFNPFRQWAADVIAPAPVLFVPTFLRVRVYPPFKQDGITSNADRSYFQDYKLRDYPTQETAEWVRREFGGRAIIKREGVAGSQSPFQVDEAQLFIDFGNNVMINAGHLAWYFTRMPNAKYDSEAGYWDHSTSDQSVMEGGRTRAQMLIDNTKKVV